MAEFTIPDEDLASLKDKVIIVTGAAHSRSTAAYAMLTLG